MFTVLFAKVYNCYSCFYEFDTGILPKIQLLSKLSGRITGNRPLSDILYLAFGLVGILAGRISGTNSIRWIPSTLVTVIFICSVVDLKLFVRIRIHFWIIRPDIQPAGYPVHP